MTRREAVDVATVAAAKLAVGIYVLTAGFSHISDDDYARVVIAEQFAHAPSLDPSGTSWLPFPFWTTGAAMLALGRSVATARVVCMLFAVVATAGLYAALRAASHPRAVALGAVALGLAVPLDAWVGAAAVPEAYTGALVAGAVLVVGAKAHASSNPRAATPSVVVTLAAAFALFASSLSRYETWPACGTFALYMGFLALRPAPPLWREPRRARLVAAAVALAGPLGWMAWNAYAHGSATHFVDRVARYRVAIHAAPESLHARLLGYPTALATTAPVVLVVFIVGVVALIALHGPALRKLAFPLATAAATLAFLIYGDVKDGAPTHHPERALLGIVWILAATGAAGVHALYMHYGATFRARASLRRFVMGGAIVATLVVVGSAARTMRNAPGRDPATDRAAQIARGEALRADGEGLGHLDVTPCAYEHFALLAAFGAPERVTIRDARPPEGDATDCPRVVVAR